MEHIDACCAPVLTMAELHYHPSSTPGADLIEVRPRTAAVFMVPDVFGEFDGTATKSVRDRPGEFLWGGGERDSFMRGCR
jgi:hypothetical protein